jgi:hypothetical protein
MRTKENALDAPDRQLGWKLTLTVLSAVVGGILAFYLFGVL